MSYSSLNFLKKHGHATSLRAHGQDVGLPLNSDMGNSEVGHNVLGAGQVFMQGSSLVDKAIADESLFATKAWQKALSLEKTQKTLHLIGLLSDGGVHSKLTHLFSLCQKAAESGLKKVRLHLLLDGRDVEDFTALDYVKKLEDFLVNTKIKQAVI